MRLRLCIFMCTSADHNKHILACSNQSIDTRIPFNHSAVPPFQDFLINHNALLHQCTGPFYITLYHNLKPHLCSPTD